MKGNTQMAAPKLTKAAAAKILRVYESEVTKTGGGVVTTSDGQRYQVTGTQPGDYTWLRDGAEAPAAEDDE